MQRAKTSFHCIIIALLIKAARTAELAYRLVMLLSLELNKEVEVSFIVEYSKVKPQWSAARGLESRKLVLFLKIHVIAL